MRMPDSHLVVYTRIEHSTQRLLHAIEHVVSLAHMQHAPEVATVQLCKATPGVHGSQTHQCCIARMKLHFGLWYCHESIATVPHDVHATHTHLYAVKRHRMQSECTSTFAARIIGSSPLHP